MSAFMNNDSVLCEYKKRFSYDKNFLTDEIMKQVISNVGEIIFDHLIEFATTGMKASELLIDAYDPCPESVSHSGDPIGRKGPRAERDPWCDLYFFETLKMHFENIKNYLSYSQEKEDEFKKIMEKYRK